MNPVSPRFLPQVGVQLASGTWTALQHPLWSRYTQVWVTICENFYKVFTFSAWVSFPVNALCHPVLARPYWDLWHTLMTAYRSLPLLMGSA